MHVCTRLYVGDTVSVVESYTLHDALNTNDKKAKFKRHKTICIAFPYVVIKGPEKVVLVPPLT